MIWFGNRYYGSTMNTLSRRFSEHKQGYKSNNKSKSTTCYILFNNHFLIATLTIL